MFIPPGETVVETKSCKVCQADFAVTDRDTAFYERISPVFAGVRCAMPSPTLCPDCRRLRRLSSENHRALYRRTCDLTGRPTVSMHHPDKPMKVYDYEAWWSDAWDPLSYGREFDFGRAFFEQYRDLLHAVPAIGMSRMNSENSDYCNQAGGLKDCYLCFNADEVRDSYYCSSIQHCADCLDCHAVHGCERCRYSTDLQKCFDCSHCHYSRDCVSSDHLFDCVGCTDCSYCFASSGLRGQSYHAYGEPVSPDEYEALLAAYRRERFDSNLRSEDLTECERVSAGGRCVRVSDSVGVEDCRYSSNITDAKDAYDIDYYGLGIELAYDSAAVGGRYSASGFCENIGGDIARIWYCASCMNDVKDCFGCIGLRNARYCILNKQYTEAEYNSLVPRIIEHMRRAGEW